MAERNERLIYLDYAATTPLDPRVARAMERSLQADFANPASAHWPGRRARQRVEKARAQVAALIGASADEIIWTSGATEANNLAIKGASDYYAPGAGHIVTCLTEHRSVLDSVRALAGQGVRIDILESDTDGRLTPQALAKALRTDTVLVSVMLVNNETGALQDIPALARVCAAHGVRLHVDAAQAAGRVPLDVDRLGADYLSLSAHKMYGPKGIGALYIRRRGRRAAVSPLMHGGGHERGLRAGTLATHQIVAMGEAAAVAASDGLAEQPRLAALRDTLWQGLGRLGGVYLNAADAPRVAGILNASFEGVEGESLFLGVSDRLAVATGSACSAADREPSYVLQALGRDPALAHASLRFSYGRFTTDEDIRLAIAAVGHEVARLRAMSPVTP